MGNKKLREVRQAAKEETKPLDAIEPMTSYALIQADSKKQGGEMINNLIYSHILNVNLKAGYGIGKNLLRNYVLVDNKAIPAEKFCVVSKTKRKEKVFIEIDIEEQGIYILLEVLGIEHQGLKTYAIRNLKRKPFDIAFYYLAVLNVQCVNGLDFDTEKANLIVKEHRAFETPYWFKDKVLLTVSSISTLTKSNINKLFKMFKEEDMDISAITGWLGYIAKDSFPDFMKDEVQAVRSSQFNNNLQIIFSLMIDARDNIELYFRLIPRTI